MTTYILVDNNYRSVLSGSDSLIKIDDRLNSYMKAFKAKEHIKRLSKIKPNIFKEAVYIAPFDSSEYVNGEYLYRKNLINVRNF